MNLPRRRSSVLVTSLLLLAGAMSACNSAAPDDEDGGGGEGGVSTVRMGIQPWIGYGAWHIAEDQGFDEDHGVDLQLTNFNTDADLSSAFASGQLEAGNAATNTVAQFIKAGQERTIVLFEDVSTTADAIVSGPDITSVADLEGKRVAYEEGTTSDVLLRYALSTEGLTIDDIEAVPTPASSAGQTLLSGDVDAAVTYEPYVSTLLQQDDSFDLLYSAGEQPGLISDTLTVNTSWAQENPEVVQNLLLVWNDAVTFYDENPEEGQSIIAEAVGASPEDLTTSFEGVEFYDLAESNDYLEETFEETSTLIEDILEDTGDTAASGVDISESVDTSYGLDAEGSQ